MNHNINKLDLTITILFFPSFWTKHFLEKGTVFGGILTTSYPQNNVICSACIIRTSCSWRRPSQRGMYVPRLNFKSGHFAYLWKRRPCLCRVFYYCICDFPCSCHCFKPNSCISRHFICLTDCMSLFQGHVTCWNSTLTGP